MAVEKISLVWSVLMAKASVQLNMRIDPETESMVDWIVSKGKQQDNKFSIAALFREFVKQLYAQMQETDTVRVPIVGKIPCAGKVLADES